jgi:hypothetical protein
VIHHGARPKRCTTRRAEHHGRREPTQDAFDDEEIEKAIAEIRVAIEKLIPDLLK